MGSRTPSHAKPLDLREETFTRTIWAVALPAIAENSLITLVHLADALIVGWLHDEVALAAAMLGGFLTWMVTAPLLALAVAATSLVARSWGEGDFAAARRHAGQALALSALIALALVAVGWPLAHRLITLLGAEPEVAGPAATYMRIVLLGAPLGLPMLIANGILRGVGNTRTPMWISAGMNVVNVVVSVVLAFGWLGAPHLGILGVAWGTAIARMVGGVAALSVLEWGRAGIHVPLVEFVHLRRGPLGRVWRLAAPAMLERGLNSVAHIVFLAIVAFLGTTALAAHSIAIHVESMAFMAAAGLGTAITAIVGQAIGARRPEMAEKAIWRALVGMGLAMGALGLLFIAFAPRGVAIFGATPEVLRLAGLVLQIGGFELLPMAAAIVLTGGLHGAGDTRSPLIVMVVCTVTLRFGAVYLFAITFGWGLAGVWIGTTLFWVVRVAGLLLVMRRGTWKELHTREERTPQSGSTQAT